METVRYSKKEAASLLGVSRSTMRRKVNSPCDNLAARICEQILAERFIYFPC
ncbi:MAG: hypothetical protein LBQ10_01015 [Desulfovibrio sp.]|nr:hypothetical protein [Desulfovibrio sp.]